MLLSCLTLLLHLYLPVPFALQCRMWYISIAPTGSHPGTNRDVDFYNAAPSSHDIDVDIPPRTGWKCVPRGDGMEPPPEVIPWHNYEGGLADDHEQSGFL